MRAKQKPPPQVLKMHVQMTLSAKQAVRVAKGQLESTPADYTYWATDEDRRLLLVRRALQAKRDADELKRATEWP